MIRSLRRKFIYIAVCSVAAVVLLLVGFINAVNYRAIRANAEMRLAWLLQRDGVLLPNVPINIDGWITEETPHEQRFYTVCVNENGEIVISNVDFIAAISKQEAEETVQELFQNGKFAGKLGKYRYASKQTPAGTLYVVLDCTRDVMYFRSFLSASIWISGLGLVLVFLCVYLISKRVMRPMEMSYQKQQHFITNASHDIKTPLAVIQAETELCEMELGESQATQEIKRQVQRLRALTDRLLFLSRMDEGDALSVQPFDLSQCFLQTVRPYKTLAERKGLTLEINAQDGITYNGDEKMFCNAFCLLMDNALKYTTLNGNIAATLKKQGKTTEITFTNDAEMQRQGNFSQLFDRFYRLETSRNSHNSGFGIGLSSVQAIVLAHKGKISAHSADGKSLCIKILL